MDEFIPGTFKEPVKTIANEAELTSGLAYTSNFAGLYSKPHWVHSQVFIV